MTLRGRHFASGASLRTVAVVVFVVTAAAGCGLRTPVRPPEDTAPVIPGTVSVTPDEGVTVVRWKRADRSADGMRLDDLTLFIVERRRRGEEGWERVASVDVVDQEKIRRRRDFSWRDTESGDFEYRVIPVLADGQEGPATEPASSIPLPP